MNCESGMDNINLNLGYELINLKKLNEEWENLDRRSITVIESICNTFPQFIETKSFNLFDSIHSNLQKIHNIFAQMKKIVECLKKMRENLETTFSDNQQIDLNESLKLCLSRGKYNCQVSQSDRIDFISSFYEMYSSDLEYKQALMDNFDLEKHFNVKRKKIEYNLILFKWKTKLFVKEDIIFEIFKKIETSKQIDELIN